VDVEINVRRQIYIIGRPMPLQYFEPQTSLP
jgi:hypothetical protein